METALDRFGRVLIPKKLREELDLQPGTVLRIEESGQKIVLQPVRGEPHLVVKGGVLVFTGSPQGDVSRAVERHRQERLKKLSPFGKKP